MQNAKKKDEAKTAKVKTNKKPATTGGMKGKCRNNRFLCPEKFIFFCLVTMRAVRVLRLRRTPVWAGREEAVRVTKAASTSRSVTQAEEEFSKAQGVFEDLNQELLEELPVLYNR